MRPRVKEAKGQYTVMLKPSIVKKLDDFVEVSEIFPTR